MLDRYELVAPLARGGMGSVHLARLPGAGGFQRLYAIKVMHPHLAEEPEFADRLLDEARIAALIHHPNAVPIVDVCHSPRGFYLVMDYVDGVTLARLLSATAKLPFRDRVRASLRVILDALAGLHAAHELCDDDGNSLGIVHRDVSPANIMVGSDGVGRITDFGIALAASRIVSSRPGLLKGKPSYMAPEQVTALPVDRRADLFAMGTVLWEALTGRRLFQAEVEVGVLMQVIGAEIYPPSSLVAEVPSTIDAVCAKALDRNVANRWESARAMRSALEAAAAGEGLLAGAHEVADLLGVTFAEEFASRRALLRDHSRGTGNTNPAGLGLRDPDAAVTRPIAVIPVPTPVTDSRSIPAIELASIEGPPPSSGLAATAPVKTPLQRRRAQWVVPVVAGSLALIAISAGVALRRPPAAPSPNRFPLGSVVASRPTPVPAAVIAVPSLLPAVAPSVHDAGGVTPVVTRPRRVERPASVRARPAAPAAPTIEENPYLRR